MISNLDFLFTEFSTIVNYPLLVSLIPIFLAGFVYFAGKIRSSNLWQYHLDNKYVSFLHGIVIINNYIFVPIILIILFKTLIFEPKNIFTAGFGLILLLIVLLNIIQKFSKDIIAWKKTKIISNTENNLFHKLNIIFEILSEWKHYLKLSLLKTIIPILLYLVIYFTLVFTYNRLVFLIVGFVWLLSMIYFSIMDTKLEQHKTFDLILENRKKYFNVSIIEFLNDGTLLKYQDEKGIVKVILVSKISEIILTKNSKENYVK